jgi:hypothetical protein
VLNRHRVAKGKNKQKIIKNVMMGEGLKSQRLKSLKVNLKIIKGNKSFEQQSKSLNANISKDVKAKKSAHYELYPIKN